MNPADHADALAILHAAAFAGSPARPWSAASFAALLGAPGVVLFTEDRGKRLGFALTRQVLDEAELLTLAVDPAHRRLGIGRSLLRRALAAALEAGVGRMMLEVGSTNAAARQLYRDAGFVEAGLRRGYFRSATVDDAVMMVKRLQP